MQAKYLDSFCFLRWSEALVQGDSLFRKFAHYLSKVPHVPSTDPRDALSLALAPAWLFACEDLSLQSLAGRGF